MFQLPESLTPDIECKISCLHGKEASLLQCGSPGGHVCVLLTDIVIVCGCWLQARWIERRKDFSKLNVFAKFESGLAPFDSD